MSIDQTVVLRGRLHNWSMTALLVICGMVMVVAVVIGPTPERRLADRLVLIAVFILGAAPLALRLRMRVEIDEGGIVVVGWARTVRIGWDHFAGIYNRRGLVIDRIDGTHVTVAVPGPTKIGAWHGTWPQGDTYVRAIRAAARQHHRTEQR